MVYPEGIDNDGDGRVNEDGIGGLDLHRNYPENWRPMPGLDLTGRGYTQGGAGEYPLSETETRAVFLFLLEHPNVSIGQTMDTSVPMLLHGPSTSRMSESMFPDDMKIYQYFDTEGKKITGYPNAGDTYWDYANIGRGDRAMRAMAAEYGFEIPREPRGEPLFGHSPDFGYLYYGAVWYGDELWNGGRLKDYDGDGQVTDLEALRYIDEELHGRYFKPWTKFNHPTLGEVEIGGFNPKFWRQNPPVELLEEWAKKEALFNLFLAQSLPQVKIVSASPEAGQEGGRHLRGRRGLHQRGLPADGPGDGRPGQDRPARRRLDQAAARGRARGDPVPPGDRPHPAKREERGPLEGQGQARGLGRGRGLHPVDARRRGPGHAQDRLET